jgi:hypothetical protein
VVVLAQWTRGIGVHMDSRAVLVIIAYFDNFEFNEFKIHPPVQFVLEEKQKNH